MTPEQIVKNYRVLEDVAKGHITFDALLFDFEFIEILVAAKYHIQAPGQSANTRRRVEDHYYMGFNTLKPEFKRYDNGSPKANRN